MGLKLCLRDPMHSIPPILPPPPPPSNLLALQNQILRGGGVYFVKPDLSLAAYFVNRAVF